MNLPPGLPITPKDWEVTPPAVQTLVMTLWQENQVLKHQLTHLQDEVDRLGERVNKNSQNSSKPPSSDLPGQRKYPQKEASGKSKGGQVGHKGTGRRLKPVAQVNKVVVIKFVACAECGALLLGEDAHPQRHQVSELPRIEPEIVEYQRHTLTCLVCGADNQPEWPMEMPSGCFGERTQALIGYLGGRMGISQRDTGEVLETVFHVEIGLGSIPAQEQAVSQALQAPVEEAEAYVRQQGVVNADETSWHEVAKQCWLWVCATPTVTFFRIFNGRGSQQAQELLGANFAGILGSDRYGAYNWVKPSQRQLCWAHLKRDFQAWVERGGESSTIGRRLLAQVKTFFGLWHQFKAGALTRAAFQSAMQPIRHEVHCLLTIGTFVQQAQTRRTCQNILQREPALWTFVDNEGVEPTNNVSERALRRSVLWRRRSFGTQSEGGSRFVERMLTAVTTLRQQKRDVLDYLAEACHSHRLGRSVLSLLVSLYLFSAPCQVGFGGKVASISKICL